MEERDGLWTAFYGLWTSVFEEAEEALDMVEEAVAVCYADEDLKERH